MLSQTAEHAIRALLYLAGPGGLAFSHAIRKGPMLTGPDLGGHRHQHPARGRALPIPAFEGGTRTP